jgi:hypothetical protein
MDIPAPSKIGAGIRGSEKSDVAFRLNSGQKNTTINTCGEACAI